MKLQKENMNKEHKQAVQQEKKKRKDGQPH